MKKLLFFLVFLFVNTLNSLAQEADYNNAIKLFINEAIVSVNNESLDGLQQSRLLNKITQIITQNGIVEKGYSNFWVVPKLAVLSTSVSETGMSQIYMAECELNISIMRFAFGHQGPVFSSFSKRLIGSSGSGKDAAINNALNNLSYNDKNLVTFFDQAKKKIDNYFKINCKDIIREANQAYSLNEYAKSIAIFFSVPSSAPCFKEAFDASAKVYVKYVEDDCSKKLVTLKAYLALAQNENTGKKNYYDSALAILKNLDPASVMCYAEAKVLIEKIEKRLDEAQKREWEYVKMSTKENADVKKEIYKAMGRISSNYQPANPTNVIIAH